MASRGQLGDDIVAVGPFWTAADPPVEIDAVALAGRRRTAVLLGEAKWSRQVDGARLARPLRQKAGALPRVDDDVRVAICAREEVANSAGVLSITSRDVLDGLSDA